MSNQMIISVGKPIYHQVASQLIYDSSPELFDFMFSNRALAESVIAKLYCKNRGHFSHLFSTALLMDGEIVGLQLGYDREQLSKQELTGGVLLLFASPISRWWHLMTKVGGVLDRYVPKPSKGTYYINNIAISSVTRGQGIGTKLLTHTLETAANHGYSGVELDVTAKNEGAIAFYRKYGFIKESVCGEEDCFRNLGLPPLVRMAHKFS